jgi:hypothetical protein
MLTIEISQEQADEITVMTLTGSAHTLVDLIDINNKNPNEHTEADNKYLIDMLQSINEVLDYFGGARISIT